MTGAEIIELAQIVCSFLAILVFFYFLTKD